MWRCGNAREETSAAGNWTTQKPTMSAHNSLKVRVRYAPSPTGLLHVGNLRTGLFAWLFARQSRGGFILRIEDTDAERSERQFEEFIYRDLHWFGIDWDEGPDIGGPYGPYRQSERFDLYREHAYRLLDAGRAFRCFCSEEDLTRQAEEAKKADISWTYPGTCYDLTAEEVDHRIVAGDLSVTRLKVRDGPILFEDIVHGDMQFTSKVISDPILLRSDGSPTYNFAVVVDDALMEISHVIRGDDHLSNTPKQVLIYEALGWPTPCFAHLSTILGPDQARLSKRHGATSVTQFREAGYLPEALMNYIALLGWSPGAEGSEVVPPDRLVAEFRLDRVNKNPVVLDTGKLNFINRQYLRESSNTLSLVQELLGKEGKLPEAGQNEWVRTVIDTLIGGVDVVNELPAALDSALEFPIDEVGDLLDVVKDSGAVELIRLFGKELHGHAHLTFEDFRKIVSKLKHATGRKGRQLFYPLRIALTGRSSGPELDKLIPLLETASRLGVPGVLGCRERIEEFVSRYG